MARFVLAATALLALALAPLGSSKSFAASVPVGLHAFELSYDEPVKSDHTYAVMPAFGWHPVRGASTYELQLATNRTFSDVSILYQDATLGAPVASIQQQVPWMSGNPYALWVRVRAVVKGRTTGWSKPFGFNTGWQNVPTQESAPTGLIRWSPVEGATGYEVWFTNLNRLFSTLTNVADEREYWTLHPGLGTTVRWRVRAVRRLTSAALPSGVTIAPYGPWSEPFTTLTPGSIASGPLKGGTAISDVQGAGPHALMAGFAWNGTDGIGPQAIGQQLWRVYVFSDKRCVNQVMAGSLTGAPAWAPRATQSLTFPGTVKELLDDETNGKILKYGPEGQTFMADLGPVTPSENATPGGSSSSSSSSSSSTPASGNGSSFSMATPGAVELPDSGWPAGRYWWTVVPVQIVDIPPDTSSSSSSSSGPPPDPTADALEYHDTELPQDACAAGRVWPFALRSAPVTTGSSSTKPYASGLALGERVVAAAKKVPGFVELPLITWKPALGAQSYEIELSRHAYPWVAVKSQTSVVTSSVLPLSKSDRGTWYYRVRGVNPNLPANAQKMTWSAPVGIKILGNQFAVVH